jgi:hypothetical protein
MPVAAGRNTTSPRAVPQLRDVTASSGFDTTVIIVWSGHADGGSTQPYLDADLTTRRKLSPWSPPPTANPGTTSRPTQNSRSSRACGYADKPAA